MEQNRNILKAARTGLVILGTILGYAGAFGAGRLVALVGIAVCVMGCYLWTYLKGQHWIFSIPGFFTPFGLIGLALLEDKVEYP